ncbi:MAG: TrgA family protein [Paracoccaceae bacterium]|jgi:hypothetical protein
MPTAARLVSAAGMALIAFLVSGMVIPLMPEGMDFGNFMPINVAVGAVCGWVVMGKRVGRGTTAAINNGLAGVATVLFWSLFIHSSIEMFDRAMRNRYGGPFEAVAAIFELIAEYGLMILVPNIIATVLIGGVLAGLAAESASRRWN